MRHGRKNWLTARQRGDVLVFLIACGLAAGAMAAPLDDSGWEPLYPDRPRTRNGVPIAGTGSPSPGNFASAGAPANGAEIVRPPVTSNVPPTAANIPPALPPNFTPGTPAPTGTPYPPGYPVATGNLPPIAAPAPPRTYPGQPAPGAITLPGGPSILPVSVAAPAGAVTGAATGPFPAFPPLTFPTATSAATAAPRGAPVEPFNRQPTAGGPSRFDLTPPASSAMNFWPSVPASSAPPTGAVASPWASPAPGGATISAGGPVWSGPPPAVQ